MKDQGIFWDTDLRGGVDLRKKTWVKHVHIINDNIKTKVQLIKH